jgi:hypothetical protein
MAETFGELHSWLDADEDPEAQTWRGDAPRAAGTKPERPDATAGGEPTHEPEPTPTVDASEARDDKS